MVYFGFTNCPDICPAELDKMGLVLDAAGVSHLYFGQEQISLLVFRKGARKDLQPRIRLCRPSERLAVPNRRLLERLSSRVYRVGGLISGGEDDVQGLPSILFNASKYETRGRLPGGPFDIRLSDGS